MSGALYNEDERVRKIKQTITKLVNEHVLSGKRVRCVQFTDGIYNELVEALGYQPIDILGYKIELLEQTQEELEAGMDFIIIDGDSIH